MSEKPPDIAPPPPAYSAAATAVVALRVRDRAVDADRRRAVVAGTVRRDPERLVWSPRQCGDSIGVGLRGCRDCRNCPDHLGGPPPVTDLAVVLSELWIISIAIGGILLIAPTTR
jgi:hypothetical protein